MRTPSGLVPEAFGPLEGVKILSTGTLIAEPFAAHLAAAFGAEVIQVEHPSGVVDPWRTLDAPLEVDGVSVSTSFTVLHRPTLSPSSTRGPNSRSF